jgi:hypothetical protein
MAATPTITNPMAIVSTGTRSALHLLSKAKAR